MSKIIYGIALITIFLLFICFMPLDENYNENNENERHKNNDIEYIDYKKNISKYRIGPKHYEFDFIKNQQPINGLGPDYTQNYPGTLLESNKMIVIPDLTVKYVDCLNTKNNRLY